MVCHLRQIAGSWTLVVEGLVKVSSLYSGLATALATRVYWYTCGEICIHLCRPEIQLDTTRPRSLSPAPNEIMGLNASILLDAPGSVPWHSISKPMRSCYQSFFFYLRTLYVPVVWFSANPSSSPSCNVKSHSWIDRQVASTPLHQRDNT